MSAPKKQPALPDKAATPTPVMLPDIVDLAFGTTLLSGAEDAARRMAYQVCPAGITPHDRVAPSEFIRKVSGYIRWPET